MLTTSRLAYIAGCTYGHTSHLTSEREYECFSASVFSVHDGNPVMYHKYVRIVSSASFISSKGLYILLLLLYVV